MSEWQKLREAAEAPQSVYVVLNGDDQYLATYDTEEGALKGANDYLKSQFAPAKVIQDFVNIPSNVARIVTVLNVHDRT